MSASRLTVTYLLPVSPQLLNIFELSNSLTVISSTLMILSNMWENYLKVESNGQSWKN